MPWPAFAAPTLVTSSSRATVSSGAAAPHSHPSSAEVRHSCAPTDSPVEVAESSSTPLTTSVSSPLSVSVSLPALGAGCGAARAPSNGSSRRAFVLERARSDQRATTDASWRTRAARDGANVLISGSSRSMMGVGNPSSPPARSRRCSMRTLRRIARSLPRESTRRRRRAEFDGTQGPPRVCGAPSTASPSVNRSPLSAVTCRGRVRATSGSVARKGIGDVAGSGQATQTSRIER